ncbi:outer membrane beta-barrel protein [Flavobacterium sp. '19STA2R22 D10 B1']|uniref:outer membrane beta-barrel protein n=1 Tax=Flavobacterium aerium TaxID=3037261 RepID=UPI00278C2232|nr:outer membrane beta-barrel protein [Flavobacterium sp. '19STA2R22 D10 B1']
MKKVLLTAIAVFAFGFANAQEDNAGFSKSDTFVTGSVGFNSQKTGDLKTNGFTFTPKVGYFVTENIAVGVGLGITTSKTDRPFAGIDERKTTVFSAEVFGRYYMSPASKFSLFGELAVGFGNTKIKDITSTPLGSLSTESKNNGFNVGFAPGVNYFIAKNFALEATFGVLSYNSSKPDVDGAESTNKFDIGLKMSDIKLGLVYKF